MAEMGPNDIEIKIKTAIDEASAAKTLGELKKSIKDLKGLALQTDEGTEAFNTLTGAIGKANFKIKELNEVIGTKTGNSVRNLAAAVTKLGQLSASGMELAAGAMGIFGDESEATMKKLVKLQAIMSFARGLEGLSQLREEAVRSFTTIGNTFKNVYTTLNAGLIKLGTAISGLTFEGIISSIAAFGRAVVTFVTETALPAITGFFTTIETMAATNPLGLILIAITAIVAALAMMIDSFKPLKMIFEGIKAVVMAVVQAVKDFLDFLGLTSFAAEEKAKKTLTATKKEKTAIEDRYDAEIAMAKITGGNVALLELKKSQEVQSNVKKQIDALNELKAASGELSDEQQKDLEDLTRTYDSEGIKQKNIYAQNLKDMEDLDYQFQLRRANAMQDGTAKTKELLRLEGIAKQKQLEADIKNIKGAKEIEKKQVEDRIRNEQQRVDIHQEALKKMAVADATYVYNAQLIELQRIQDEKEQADAKVRLEEKVRLALADIDKKYDKLEKEAQDAKTAEDAEAQRKAAEEQKQRDEKRLQDKIQKIEEEYAIKIARDENALTQSKMNADKQIEIASDLFNFEMNTLQKSGENKESAKKKYIKSINDNVNLELQAEKKLYEDKKAKLDDLIKNVYNKDLKKKQQLIEEKTKLELEYKQTTQKYQEIGLAEFLKTEEESIAGWKETLTKKSDLYEADFQKLKEIRDFELEFYKDDAKKLIEVQHNYDVEKFKLDTQYAKEKEELLKQTGEKEIEETDLSLIQQFLIGRKKLKNMEDFNTKEIDAVKKARDEKFKILEDEYALEIKLNGESLKATSDYEAKRKEIKEKAEKEIADLKEKYREQEAQKVVNDLGQYVSAVEGALSSVTNLINQLATNKINASELSKDTELKNLDEQGAAEMKAAEDSITNKDELEAKKNEIGERYAKKEQAIKEQTAKAENDVRRKQFRQEKALNLVRAAMDGTMAVLKALASSPPPANFILAGIAGAAAAVQIAAIAATKPPKDLEGADVSGGNFSNFSASTSTGSSSGQSGPTGQMPQAPAFFRLGQGGPNVLSQQGSQGAYGNKVYVVESDITSTQNRVSTIESRAATKLGA